MTPHARRFAYQSAAQGKVNESYHPVGTADTPMVMPMTRVQVGSTGLAYDELTPLVMPDGRMIPATAPHTWFQLYAAGRP